MQEKHDPEVVPEEEAQLEVTEPDGQNPYTAEDFDGIQDPDAVDTGLGGASGTSSPDAPNNTKQAMSFLRRQATSNSTAWRALCLSLQRQARGLPGVYPSALAAQHATPQSERVEAVKNLKRGMVIYFDDPNDSNPYGHIAGVAGFRAGKAKTLDNLLVWSNDARVSGGVSLVAASFFPNNWGDQFQFGATWLNGYDFADFDKAPPKPAELGSRYDRAIELLVNAVEYHRKAGHDRLVAALKVDLERMRNRRKKWS